MMHKSKEGKKQRRKYFSFLHLCFFAYSPDKGDILVSVLVFAAIAVTITIGLVNWGASMITGVRVEQDREQAFQIAEAGIDYYEWHLAQDPLDYQDGTNHAGPYIHQFTDKNGTLIGSYALTITPPPIGSTKVTILSQATTTADSNISRTIQAVLAVPSLAQYSVVANDYLRFGAGTQVNGPIISNYGIHFDGVAYNTVSSAEATYTDPDNTCTPQPSCATEWGVFTDNAPADPQPPTLPSAHSDVFVAGRQYPVPAVDFTGLTVNLQQLQTAARTTGYDYTQSQSGGHAAQGYHMVLNTNGTYNLYVVTALTAAPSGCTTDGTSQWGTWSIQTQTPYVTTGHPTGVYSFPSNGIVFFEDNLWADGQINGARLTIAAGKFPDTPGSEPNITVNNNLLYTNFNGNDVLGLIAQGNVNVGLISPDTISIDGALVAENGRVGRFYYGTSCKSGGTNYYTRSTLNLNGMIATNQRYGFAYTDGTGYQTRNISYDGNLLYSPPPSFPLATSQYQVISWQEVQ